MNTRERMKLLMLLVFTTLSVALGAQQFPDCSPQNDAHMPFNGTAGPFGPVENHTVMFQGHPIVVIAPTNGSGFPLMVFMHGSTGQIEMYQHNLRNYASHGFAVAFPYVKNPEDDKHPLTTNTDGEYILRAIDYVVNASATNTSAPLYGKVDVDSIVIAGHSMGATCSIMASHRAPTDARVKQSSVKLTVTQHPGICGPFGPPPWPSTWLKSELGEVAADFPVLFTTATNDGAFWPAPQTAAHEMGCFEGGVPSNGTQPATFVQFSAAACPKTGEVPGFDDSGHDCPFKSGVETPWVLTAMKLYAQHDGDMSTNCAKMLYGDGSDSIASDHNVEKVLFRSRPVV